MDRNPCRKVGDRSKKGGLIITGEIPYIFKENGGWHFTSMGGADQVRKKLEAYDHQEYNLPWLKETMEQRIEMGLDFAGRPHDWQAQTIFIPFRRV